MPRSLPLLLAVCSLLAAFPSFAQPAMTFAPQGPGTVFATIEAAAVDGLAWAHQLQRESSNPRLARGGAIVALDEGFTYRELQTASPRTPDAVRMRLGDDAVAHFHTYPRQGRRIDRDNEAHSRRDRWVVDRVDSRRRPSFVLTPSLRVVAYRGRDENRIADAFVASLARPGDDQMLAAH